MASTNWSISERTVPLAFGRNRFGEMNGEFARSNRRFAPFYAKKGSSVTIVRPKRTHCKRVSAIECRVVQPAGGESVGVAPHRRCTVRNGAGLRPTLKVKVWAAQPAPRASVRCPLPPSVVWVVMVHVLRVLVYLPVLETRMSKAVSSGETSVSRPKTSRGNSISRRTCIN